MGGPSVLGEGVAAARADRCRRVCDALEARLSAAAPRRAEDARRTAGQPNRPPNPGGSGGSTT